MFGIPTGGPSSGPPRNPTSGWFEIKLASLETKEFPLSVFLRAYFFDSFEGAPTGKPKGKNQKNMSTRAPTRIKSVSEVHRVRASRAKADGRQGYEVQAGPPRFAAGVPHGDPATFRGSCKEMALGSKPRLAHSEHPNPH